MFATVTMIPGEVAVLPAASRATAVSVCDPLPPARLSHVAPYGAVVSSAPTFAPSTLNWTPAIPTLSFASAVIDTAPETVVPAGGAVIVAVGAVRSLSTVMLTATDDFVLPAASRATEVRVWPPFAAVFVFQLTEYGAVVSSAPRLAPSSLNWTPMTPTLSLAVALTVVVSLTMAPSLGAVRFMSGGVVSGSGLLTVMVTDAEVAELAAASRATAVRVCEPLADVAVFHVVE